MSATIVTFRIESPEHMSRLIGKMCGHKKELTDRELQDSGQPIYSPYRDDLEGPPGQMIGCTECCWDRGVELGPLSWVKGLKEGEWCWMECGRCLTPVDSRDVVWILVANGAARINVCPACALGHSEPDVSWAKSNSVAGYKRAMGEDAHE